MSKKKAISMIQTLKRDCIHTYISHDISKEVCRDLRFRLDEIIKELSVEVFIWMTLETIWNKNKYMTKEEAIKYLQQLYPNGGHCWLDEQRIEAIGVAVKALQENGNSLTKDEFLSEFLARTLEKKLGM